MKSKILKITILTLMIIMFMQISSFASILKINLEADKENVKIGEEVKVTVSWNQGMQAADFYLIYDSKKLEFVEADIEDDYINAEEGNIKTAWFSMDDTDKTQIEYTFKPKKAGKVEIETKVNGGFATGNLQIPNKYEEGNLTIEISQSPVMNALKIIAIVIGVVIVFVLIIIVTNIRIEKSRKKLR